MSLLLTALLLRRANWWINYVTFSGNLCKLYWFNCSGNKLSIYLSLHTAKLRRSTGHAAIMCWVAGMWQPTQVWPDPRVPSALSATLCLIGSSPLLAGIAIFRTAPTIIYCKLQDSYPWCFKVTFTDTGNKYSGSWCLFSLSAWCQLHGNSCWFLSLFHTIPNNT